MRRLVAASCIARKTEGAHATDWQLDEATSLIAMTADRLVDGTVFDPLRLTAYLDRFAIRSLRMRLDELPESLVRGR